MSVEVRNQAELDKAVEEYPNGETAIVLIGAGRLDRRFPVSRSVRRDACRLCGSMFEQPVRRGRPRELCPSCGAPSARASRIAAKQRAYYEENRAEIAAKQRAYREQRAFGLKTVTCTECGERLTSAPTFLSTRTKVVSGPHGCTYRLTAAGRIEAEPTAEDVAFEECHRAECEKAIVA